MSVSKAAQASPTGTYARGEETRRRMIEAAIEMFALRGYEGASTRLLAESAGVNLPAIQYYFGSKEGLYRAVVDHVIERIAERMAPPLHGSRPRRRGTTCRAGRFSRFFSRCSMPSWR